jgi:hypothetical protein
MKLKKRAKQLIQAKSRFLRGTGEAKRVNMVKKKFPMATQIQT